MSRKEVRKMPMMDKTGPRGMGPGTGRGMGPCAVPAGRQGAGVAGGLGWGRGYGRVMCGWFWQKYQGMPKSERKELLKAEAEDLKQELEMVQGELKKLEK
ncbi:MAG: hypothetical protein COS72_02885 [Candidatus Moranbacteria bacterium CG06_land_8_20_14_3_00_43_56]|nr:MAG: hypothetical protein COS72_02885 [Candidatus Moranbacteria bacterium CG06_land_8_20_14_3_00_43_56]PIV84484.1 MAG: hypothetical protein COW51_00185 [Candidatus Moranbacteria bacterium CG17_big_fil_post_rev_8_21_14_2_50_44_12]PIW93256.1 MAG: hypothetical protein COZ87_02245 [Candidatus Moranbacteria bacterium CG_4_8_14_3_um_filter_43_15]PJA85388.1 MAG: hypothetical protein CO142_03990 [Candidatus Moranbacteria bacterium CG_4_9_14_3_um_filter_44_28]